MLGLGNNLKKTGLTTPGIVTDGLVMKHMYPAGVVQPVSDGAIEFDGSSDSYVYAEDSSSLDFTDAFSSACWIRPHQASADWKYVYAKGDLSSGTQSIKLVAIDTNGLYKFEVNELSASRVTSTTVLGNNSWAHIACTYDKTNTKIYINGVLEDTTSFSTAIGTNNERLHIGNGKSTDGGWKGLVCNMGMWNVALSQAEIKSIMFKQYADLSTSESANLVSWWAFDTDANDATGTNNGTISGG